MLPPCVPTRRYSTRCNTKGRAHFFSLNSFHWQPLLVGDLRKAWLAQAVKRISTNYRVSLMAYSFVPRGALMVVKPTHADTDLRYWADDIKEDFTQRWLAARTLRRAQEHRSFQIVGANGSKCFRLWQPFLNRYSYADSNRCMERLIRRCHEEPLLAGVAQDLREWRWSSVSWRSFEQC